MIPVSFVLLHGKSSQIYTNPDDIHKIMASAFLEPNQVGDDFDSLCSELEDDYQMVLDYMEDTYIGRLRRRSRRVPIFSINLRNTSAHVKNNMHRTNNSVEAVHRILNSTFQCAHRTSWTFSDK